SYCKCPWRHCGLRCRCTVRRQRERSRISVAGDRRYQSIDDSPHAESIDEVQRSIRTDGQLTRGDRMAERRKAVRSEANLPGAGNRIDDPRPAIDFTDAAAPARKIAVADVQRTIRSHSNK